MLRRAWLAFALVVAPVAAWAQPAQAPATATAQAPAPTTAATDRALATATAVQRRVGELAAARAAIGRRYQAELVAIDQLKQQRASWRRDRELRASLSASSETANQLAAVTSRLAAAQASLARARRAVIAAIDGELAAGAIDPRAAQLRALRARLAPAVHPAPERIVVPDTDVDPLADPEELDAQAAAIRASEQQLERQVIGLDVQARDLDHVSAIRKQHQRALDLGLRDDDQPQRGVAHNSSADSAATPTGSQPGEAGGGAGSGAGSPTGGGGGGSTGGGTTGIGGGTGGGISGGNDPSGPDRATSLSALDTEAIILGDVIDHATIAGLVRASRSSDPAARARAARKARDAVAARLAQLKKQRAAIEARARQLRGH